MAEKTKSKTTAPRKPRAPKAKRKNRKYVIPLGASGGVALAGAHCVLDPSTGVGGSAPAINWMFDKSQTIPNRIKYATSAAVSNIATVETAVPIVGGAVISAAKRIPILKIVAKPVDNLFRALSKGKVGL